MSKLLLIDSDFILYKICFNRVLSETEQMYGIKSEKTLQETLDLIDWYLVEKIFKPTSADYYLGFLGGDGNYRYSVDSAYKSGRSSEKPPFFKEVKQYLIDKWEFIIVNGIEAEDAVGISLTTYSESIIVGQDHDLLQLPGTHYNPVKNEVIDLSIQDAEYNFWKQMITGCSTDKVSGIPRIGEIKATKFLEKFYNKNNSDIIASSIIFAQKVLCLYIQFFGEYKGIQKFAKNHQLLKILREKEGFVIPEIKPVNKIKIVEQIVPEF